MGRLNEVVFLYPYAFLILIVYLICIFLCKPKSQSIYFSNIKMLKEATKYQGIAIKILRFLIVLFITIALASPVIKNDIIINNNKGYEISIILDASGSMREANKFNITKEIVSDFIKKRKTDRLALSIFADFAYVAVPLTYDKKSLLNLLSHIDVGVAGQRQTALYEALYLSSNLFKNSKSKNKIAILLTDGLDNAGTIPLKVAIQRAKKYGIKVYTIGIGSIGDFNPTVLNKIATSTGGKFYEANSVKKIQQIYDEINHLEKSEIKTQKFVKKDYYYQYPLDIALGLLFMLILLSRKSS
jgi:Ca-activated chloride channel family protein